MDDIEHQHRSLEDLLGLYPAKFLPVTDSAMREKSPSLLFHS